MIEKNKMKPAHRIALKAILEVIFLVGFIVIPTFMGTMFGMSLNDTGILMGRLFGIAFLFGALVLWLCKNFPWPEAQKIVIGTVISNVIGFVVSLLATLAGTWNAVGWLTVGLYLVFGLVFAYFLFIKKSV
jgi:hypothetical protein